MLCAVRCFIFIHRKCSTLEGMSHGDTVLQIAGISVERKIVYLLVKSWGITAISVYGLEMDIDINTVS